MRAGFSVDFLMGPVCPRGEVTTHSPREFSLFPGPDARLDSWQLGCTWFTGKGRSMTPFTFQKSWMGCSAVLALVALSASGSPLKGADCTGSDTRAPEVTVVDPREP